VIFLTVEHPISNVFQNLGSPYHLLMGLALSKNGSNVLRLPSGISPREAKVGHFQAGPLHKNLEKGFE
jgi:hypothetical protein